jgi:outer membrane protein insertion porin family
MNRFLLLLLPAFLYCQNLRAQEDFDQKKYTIKAITVSGIQFLDPTAIINLSGLKVGDTIRVPGTDMAGAIRKLWGKGLFGTVDISATQIEGDAISLDIFLQERPKISRIEFKGIKKGDQTKLSEKLGTIKGTVVSDAVIKNAQLTIKKYYAEKGFYNAKINVVQKRDSLLKNSLLMRFEINKGPKVKVRAIDLEGVGKVSPKRIKKTMKTKEKKPFRIFSSSKFIANKLEEDKKKVINYYNSKGYRDARIVEDTFYLVSDSRLKVEWKIEEGQKYYFRSIGWEGNFKYTDAQLSSILGIKKGDVYNKEELNKRLQFSFTEQDISSLYMDDGYLFFSIRPVEVGVEGDSIDIVMRMSEGPQADINQIIINGNTRTSDHVIRREIRTIPGQKFSRQNIIRTQQALGQMGYFDAEKIQIDPKPNVETGTVDIEYTLEERPSDQLELSGGWGGAFGFVGTLGVVFNNFSIRRAGRLSSWRPIPTGDGQRLALRAQANGRAFQTYSATFTEPWLGGRKPNSLTVNFSYTVNQRIDFRGNVFGKLEILGGSVGIGRRLSAPDDYFTLSNTLNYQNYRLTNFNIGSGFSNGDARNFTFITTLARNSINNPTFPRTGSSFSLSLALTPPYSLFDGLNTRQEYNELSLQDRFQWVEYHKWMFDASTFTPVAGKLVLNARVHFGLVAPYNQNKGASPFERFILGGSGLAGQNFIFGTDIIGLRGYNDNSIVPFNPTGERTGGTVFNKYVMELRYPVSLNPAATIFVLSFLEGGNTWESPKEFNPFNIYRSAGVGARIFMPAFGLIGIDYGIGFDRIPGNPGASGGQFHFIIGQQIR